MYINRNVLKVVASALLIVSVPAGAQVLGGNLGGAANGTLGSTFGRTNVDGAARATGDTGIDASSVAGTARDRAQRVSGKTREVGAGAAGTARSRVASTRGAADATAYSAHSVGVGATQRVADSAAHARSATVQQPAAAQASDAPRSGVFASGSGAAATQQSALGRTVSAESATDWDASGDRSGLRGGAASEAEVSVKKDTPAQ